MALRERFGEAGIDALWVSSPPNVRYLSGFSSPQDAKLLLLPDQVLFYTDARYTVQAASEVSVPVQIARPPETLKYAAKLLRALRVGFEAPHLTVDGLAELETHWPQVASLVPTRGLVEQLRVIKDAEEIALIRRAQAIADAAYSAALPQLEPGISESELALQLEIQMRRLGADGPAFDFTVASGERGARPHAGASAARLEAGQLVTLDFGARVQGYHSDMTRTLALGEVGPELRRIYNAVLEAQETALAAVRPGVSTAELDRLAREVLTGQHLGEYFAHSLGHGVGLEIHEAPGLRAASEEVLQPGMVITLEPGVYKEHLGGVRIEELVLVTESGYEVLSSSPKVRL